MNFDDVYGGPKRTRRSEAFLKYSEMGYSMIREQGLHSNTITIKPYPDKVSSDPTAGSKAYRWWVALA